MADEAVVTELLGNNGDVIQMTCAEATDISQGAILKLTDPRTCIINSGAGDVLAGIAAHDFTGGEGRTTIGVITNCIAKFKIVSGGTTTLGSSVRVSGTANQITLLTTLDEETGKSLGKALETGASTETVLVRVRTLS